jgi:hypothetical protein
MWYHPVNIQWFNQLFSPSMTRSKLQKLERKWWQDRWYTSNYLFSTKRKWNPWKQSPFMFNIFPYSWEVRDTISRQVFLHVHNRLYCIVFIFIRFLLHSNIWTSYSIMQVNNTTTTFTSMLKRITKTLQVNYKVMPLHFYLHINKNHMCQKTISHIILDWNISTQR